MSKGAAISCDRSLSTVPIYGPTINFYPLIQSLIIRTLWWLHITWPPLQHHP